MDKGPSPYDLILAALGSSTAMTIRKYADQERWKLDKAIVKLVHSRKHIREIPHVDKSHKNPSTKVDYFERTIELVGDLSHDQRVELLKVNSHQNLVICANLFVRLPIPVRFTKH